MGFRAGSRHGRHAAEAGSLRSLASAGSELSSLYGEAQANPVWMGEQIVDVYSTD